VETLVELDIEYGHLARDAGVPDYVRVPALGVAPDYIEALAEEVTKALASAADIIGDEACAGCHTFCPKRTKP
jgi:ferrochelatase